MSAYRELETVTVPGLKSMKQTGRKIVAVTAYDYAFARLFDQSGVDVILVGDSLGMVVQGHETTTSVTLEEMIYHTRLVTRGTRRALVTCDLPFGSFQGGCDMAMRSAVRAMKESGCQSVKLEGGVVMAETIQFLSERGVPVMAHVGLTPQSVHCLGGFKTQGHGETSDQVVSDALAVDEAGAFALILEAMPAVLAKRITQKVSIPTIGIGAGPSCDGQVLVSYDLLGFYDNEAVQPKFVKRYLEGGAMVREAISRFSMEVRQGEFPTREHSFES